PGPQPPGDSPLSPGVPGGKAVGTGSGPEPRAPPVVGPAPPGAPAAPEPRAQPRASPPQSTEVTARIPPRRIEPLAGQRLPVLAGHAPGHAAGGEFAGGPGMDAPQRDQRRGIALVERRQAALRGRQVAAAGF